MISTGYAFTSAYLKGEEARLVTSEHVDRMSKTSTIQDALGVIKETDIGSYLEEVPLRTFDDVEEYLWVYIRSCLERLEGFRLLPAGMLKILRAYMVKYDVLNIKAALWGISTGRKARMIPVGAVHSYGLMDRLASAENLKDIVETLTECKLGNYAEILEEHEKHTSGGAKSRLTAEARLDSEYYKNMLDTARATKDGVLFSKVYGILIDLTNLQIVSRAIIEGMGPDAAECTIAGGYLITERAVKDLLSLKMTELPHRLENTQYSDVASEISSSYDRTGRITAVQEIIDKHQFRLLKEILSPRVLSPLVIAWYLIIKEVEIRNLRLVLKMIVDGMPVDEIKEYLVL